MSSIAVVVDTVVANWVAFSAVPLADVLERVLFFVKAFTFQRQGNCVSLLAMDKSSTVILRSRSDVDIVGLLDQIKRCLVYDEKPVLATANSIGKALCILNRSPASDKRILLVSSSPDNSLAYANTMNATFSAEKNKVAIDVCFFGQANDRLLRQASLVSSGVYIKIEDKEQLILCLMCFFQLDQQTRGYVVVPRQSHLDSRITCFCHKTFIEIGYVCGICLSVYCCFRPVCPNCNTRFSFPKIKN